MLAKGFVADYSEAVVSGIELQGSSLQNYQQILENPFLASLALGAASYSFASSAAAERLFIDVVESGDFTTDSPDCAVHLEDIPIDGIFDRSDGKYYFDIYDFGLKAWEESLRIFDEDKKRRIGIKHALLGHILFPVRPKPMPSILHVNNEPEVDSWNIVLQREVASIASSYRRKQAKELLTAFSISQPYLVPNLVPNLAFGEILRIVKFQRKVSVEEARVIAFLEDAIQRIFPSWLEDLGVLSTASLQELRKKYFRGRNGACFGCHKTLMAKGPLLQEYTFCKDCLAKKRRTAKKDKAIRAALKSVDHKCEVCGSDAYIENNFHRERSTQRWRIFCSQRCYQLFRKRKQRMKQ